MTPTRGECARCFAPVLYTEGARILSVGPDGRACLAHERCVVSPWVLRNLRNEQGGRPRGAVSKGPVR